MNTIDILAITLLGLCILTLIANHYFHGYRNNKVYDLRIHINKLCYDYSERKEFNESGYDKFYNKLPSYDKMVYSFKKLKLESYFTKEEIEELLNR